MNQKKILQSWKLYLNVTMQHFIHSAVLADSPAPRSTLSRWHDMAQEDSIFNPLGTGSAKQEVERMLRVRRQSQHFRLANCCTGHTVVPRKYACRTRRQQVPWHQSIERIEWHLIEGHDTLQGSPEGTLQIWWRLQLGKHNLLEQT